MRTKIIPIRVTEEEHKNYKEVADRKQTTLSNVVRRYLDKEVQHKPICKDLFNDGWKLIREEVHE